MTNWIRAHLGHTLYLNTYLLFTIRIVATGFGFLFWALAARTIPAGEVGLASGLVSAAVLLAGLAQLGFGYALIRHLPTSNQPFRLINGTFLIVGIVGLLLGLGFLLGLPLWSPALLPLRSNLSTSFLFVILVVTLSLTTLTHWTFLARRKPALTLAKQVIQVVLALLLLLGLSRWSGNYVVIMVAYTLAVFTSFGIALFLFLPKIEGGFKFKLSRPANVRSPLTTYALSNHAADQLQKVPDVLMVLLVINVLGPQAGAYFFIAWAIAGGLLALAASVSPALLTEGANAPQMVSILAKKSFKLGLLLATVLALAAAVSGRLLLAIYGSDYVQNAYGLLLLLLASILPSALLAIFLSLLRVKNQLKPLLIVTAGSMVSGLLLAYLLMHSFGLLGAGFGWLLSRLLMLGCISIIWKLQPVPTSTRTHDSLQTT